MTKFNFSEIKWEDYNEVEADRYKLYYEQDTLVIRLGARIPAYFVRKDAKGTKEHQQEALDRAYVILRDKIRDILASENIVPKEKLRQEIEKLFKIQEDFKHIYHPELSDLCNNLKVVRETLNGNKGT